MAEPSAPPSKKESLVDPIDTETIATKVDSNQDAQEKSESIEQPNNANYLEGRRLFVVHMGILVSVLLVALDQTIVSTALPKLSSYFNALDQLTWVVSTYFLTQAGLMLFYGQVLTIVSTKHVFIFCIVLFEIGSLICGVAPSIEVLIFGRAIQGVGASGGFISILTIIAQIARLELRPILLGSFGAVFGFASVIGPLLGGVFTDKVTWRWCFYINLPFGAISLTAVIIWFPVHPPMENAEQKGKTTLQKWAGLDWVGGFLSTATITTFLLPLQWGGVTRPWNDRVVIALFVTSGVLFIIFGFWERKLGDRAMVPLKLFRGRTQVSAGICMFLIMTSFISATYYLPFFYQAKGRTAAQSGIDIIPFMLSMVVGSGFSGWITNYTGRYWFWLVSGPVLSAIAAGLLFTIDGSTPNPKLIGFQILLGFGLGLCFNLPLIAIQAEYAAHAELISQASSLVTMQQLLGGVVGIAVAGSVFGNQLAKELSVFSAVISPELLKGVKQSVSVIFMLPEPLKTFVIKSYISSLDYAFILGVPASGLALISALFVKNWNLKTRGVETGSVAV